MGRKATITDRGEVSIEQDGQVFTASWTLTGQQRVPMLEVHSVLGRKVARLGSFQPEGMARILLRELMPPSKKSET